MEDYLASLSFHFSVPSLRRAFRQAQPQGNMPSGLKAAHTALISGVGRTRLSLLPDKTPVWMECELVVFKEECHQMFKRAEASPTRGFRTVTAFHENKWPPHPPTPQTAIKTTGKSKAFH